VHNATIHQAHAINPMLGAQVEMARNSLSTTAQWLYNESNNMMPCATSLPDNVMVVVINVDFTAKHDLH